MALKCEHPPCRGAGTEKVTNNQTGRTFRLCHDHADEARGINAARDKAMEELIL